MITPAEFKRRVNYLEETQYKNKRPKLTVRQIMFQIFSFFKINQTQGHTMNLSDLLYVELYNDNLKMFNQAWEDTLLAFGNDLDEHFLENLYERQEKRSTLMKNAMTLHQQDIVLKKEPSIYQRLRIMVNAIL